MLVCSDLGLRPFLFRSEGAGAVSLLVGVTELVKFTGYT